MVKEAHDTSSLINQIKQSEDRLSGATTGPLTFQELLTEAPAAAPMADPTTDIMPTDVSTSQPTSPPAPTDVPNLTPDAAPTSQPTSAALRPVPSAANPTTNIAANPTADFGETPKADSAGTVGSITSSADGTTMSANSVMIQWLLIGLGVGFLAAIGALVCIFSHNLKCCKSSTLEPGPDVESNASKSQIL